MLLIFIVLLILTSGVLLFHQNDWILTFERVELFRHNEEYVTNCKVLTYKYNRTTPVLNATFTYTKDFNDDLQVTVQAYKFMSNEYRLFPLRFQFDLCKTATLNDFGLGGFYTCGNFSRCPVKKGRYHICNWQPDGARFPPLIPEGRYMLDLQVMYFSHEVMVLRLYGTASIPIKKETHT